MQGFLLLQISHHHVSISSLIVLLYLIQFPGSLSIRQQVTPTAKQSGTNSQSSSSLSSSSSTSIYSFDVSNPVHNRVSTNYPWLEHNKMGYNNTVPIEYMNMPIQPLGDRHSLYLQHLDGCRQHYSNSKESCDSCEFHRISMNQRQPQSIKNYTKTGFKVIKTPDHVFQLVQDFWKKNHYKGKEEQWFEGSTYINHWDQPTYLVSVDDSGLRGSGKKLKDHIWAAASATLESWTSQELQPSSLYGIRVYSEGALMLSHVNRLPLVISAMINVAQDLDEDWPHEVYDHDGVAHNVTLQPGDMLLFEGASTIHGHPFPLKGRFYALICIHFEPTGQSLLRNASGYFMTPNATGKTTGSTDGDVDIHRQYQDAVESGRGGASSDIDPRKLPPYLNPYSPEEEHWKLNHPEGWTPSEVRLPPDAHVWAKNGDIEQLQQQLINLNTNDTNNNSKTKNILNERDDNGWQILHQGVAGGNTEIVELLLNSGADLNSRTHGGYGETPLRLAERIWGDNTIITNFLKSKGALSLGPEL